MNKLLTRTEEYWAQAHAAWDGVRAKQDVKSVHELRVATRRLQASLSLLESALQRRHPSRARRRLKRLMKRLGPLRDLQVQLQLIGGWKKSPSTTAFTAFLRREERAECSRIRRYLTNPRRKKIRSILKRFERAASAKLETLSGRRVRKRVDKVLKRHRGELELLHSRAALKDTEALHDLRKTTRKLRYSLEASASALGSEVYAEIQELRRQQGKLGRKRDIQVLKKRFRTWQHESLIAGAS